MSLNPKFHVIMTSGAKVMNDSSLLMAMFPIQSTCFD